MNAKQRAKIVAPKHGQNFLGDALDQHHLVGEELYILPAFLGGADEYFVWDDPGTRTVLNNANLETAPNLKDMTNVRVYVIHKDGGSTKNHYVRIVNNPNKGTTFWIATEFLSTTEYIVVSDADVQDAIASIMSSITRD